MTKILECSSVGDKRFSSFYAIVNYGGVSTSIENHYQNSKHWYEGRPKKTKGETPDAMRILTPDGAKIVEFPLAFLTLWFKLLWLMYLDANQELVMYAMEFDDYNDIFKGKSINCQADVIRQYVKEGRDSVYYEVLPLINLLKKKMEV